MIKLARAFGCVNKGRRDLQSESSNARSPQWLKVDEEHEQDIKAVGGVLYGAGVETVCTQQLLFLVTDFSD